MERGLVKSILEIRVAQTLNRKSYAKVETTAAVPMTSLVSKDRPLMRTKHFSMHLDDLTDHQRIHS